MPIEYIMPIVGGNEKKINSMRVLTNKITQLEKLQETRMQTIEITRIL